MEFKFKNGEHVIFNSKTAFCSKRFPVLCGIVKQTNRPSSYRFYPDTKVDYIDGMYEFDQANGSFLVADCFLLSVDDLIEENQDIGSMDGVLDLI